MSDADLIKLVDYDPSWPAMFADEVEAIRGAIGGDALDLRFEHVGSTAVAGLIAKPIIDVLVIPPPNVWPREMLTQRLPKIGYVFWGKNPDFMHLFFVKGMPPFGTARTHHIHVRHLDKARPVIAFRDYLRANADAAAEYATLKRHLAAAHPQDREAYTRGKDSFVRKALL